MFHRNFILPYSGAVYILEVEVDLEPNMELAPPGQTPQDGSNKLPWNVISTQSKIFASSFCNNL
jgi:hypothetical protein